MAADKAKSGAGSGDADGSDNDSAYLSSGESSLEGDVLSDTDESSDDSDVSTDEEEHLANQLERPSSEASQDAEAAGASMESVKSVEPGTSRYVKQPRQQQWPGMLKVRRAVRDEAKLLRAIYRAGEEAKRLSADEVKFGLVTVDCTPYKEAIARRTRELVACISSLVIDDVIAVTECLRSRYRSLADRVRSRPADAKGLEEQRDLLSTINKTVLELDTVAADSIERLENLREFGVVVPGKVIAAAWRVRRRPSEIENDEIDASTYLEELTKKLQEQLKKEKHAFETELKELPDKVLRFYSLGGKHLEDGAIRGDGGLIFLSDKGRTESESIAVEA